MTAQAFYRGYVNGGERAGQVRRLHILRESGTRSVGPGKQGWCGTTGWNVTHSGTVFISPLPARPPEGLQWCPCCVGRYAERLGLLGDIAGEVAAYDPELTDLHAQRWWAFVDGQREQRAAALQVALHEGGAR